MEQRWRIALELMQSLLNDYCRARSQLEETCRALVGRGKDTEQRLRCLLGLAANASQADPAGRDGADYGQDTRLDPEGAPPVLRACCFGSFEIYLDGKKIDRWPSLKAKSLLKFLVAFRNRPVARDVLVETLWPECAPEAGRNNLKAAIYALRQLLLSHQSLPRAPQLVLFSEGQYLINPDAQLLVDVDEFERRWLTGRSLEKEGRHEEAAEEYRRAERLYRGDYSEDDIYADWTLLRREAWKDAYLTILGKLANSSFEAGDHESCILYSQRILARDVCHEEAYRWLIRCYSRSGNYYRARQWYDLCAAILKKELDAVPDRKTTALLRHIPQQEPA
ncbi:MAG: winged helix-turn-helix domain-containing protein [Chloroflexi bacterium]|nr:winged helix-turn-helix domain-containing protein [Chloroflexota bacterium]